MAEANEGDVEAKRIRWRRVPDGESVEPENGSHGGEPNVLEQQERWKKVSDLEERPLGVMVSLTCRALG